MKKKLVAILICLFTAFSVMAQQPGLVFGYDLSGNRVLRTISVTKMNGSDSTFNNLNVPQQNENLTVQKFSVYPNPSDGFVNIDLNLHPEQNANYMLLGINGTIIEQGIITSTQTQLNLLNYGKGTYILQIASGLLKEKFKIVKQ